MGAWYVYVCVVCIYVSGDDIFAHFDVHACDVDMSCQCICVRCVDTWVW